MAARRAWAAALVLLLGSGVPHSADAAAIALNAWTATGSMITGRQYFAMTLLRDGTVLVAGGYKQEGHALASAEVYHPLTGTWSATGRMTVGRIGPTAVLLADGRVLVAGGDSDAGRLASAEIYDPGSGRWTVTGRMSIARRYHTATVLPNGRVLVAGGVSGTVQASAEVYDPQTGAWATTGTMTAPRYDHTATLLRTGDVLVAGGYNDNSGAAGLASAELYHSQTGQWSITGAMREPRYYHSATLLLDGRVLVAGGTSYPNPRASAEVYDAATGRWTATGSMPEVHTFHTATLLASGQVLVAGGTSAVAALTTAILYDPRTGMWSTTGSMAVGREFHAAVALQSGQVLVAGGAAYPSLASAEVYTPGTGPLADVGPAALDFGFQPTGQSSALQTVSLTNTSSVPLTLEAAAISSTAPSAFPLASSCLGTPLAPRSTCTLSLRFAPTSLGPVTGTLLITDGAPDSPQSVTLRGMAYDSGPDGWAPAAPITSPVGRPLLNLPDGRILSLSSGGPTFYDPRTDTWQAGRALPILGNGPTATLLRDGLILLAGGADNTGDTSKGCTTTAMAVGDRGVAHVGTKRTQDRPGGVGPRVIRQHLAAPWGPPPPPVPLCASTLYDPAADTWTATGRMTMGRFGHSATLLHDGRVLVAGGTTSCTDSDCTRTASAELYDPHTGTWRATGPMTTARAGHTAVLLASGRVLVIGGNTGPTTTAEIYDPDTGTWARTADLLTPRVRYAAVLLTTGEVLVSGGTYDTVLSSAELYDPRTGHWTATGSMAVPREDHTATLLADGRVLVAGGCCPSTTSTELYDPRTGAWTSGGPMIFARSGHSAVVLPRGQIFVAGGTTGLPFMPAERYTPGPLPHIGLAPPRVTLGNQAVATGVAQRTITITNLSAAAVTVSAVTITGSAAADFAAAQTCRGVVLAPATTCAVSIRFAPQASGFRHAQLIVTDSVAGETEASASDVTGFGSGPNAWMPGGDLSHPRYYHTATLLPNGSVLVAGGSTQTFCDQSSCAGLSSAEVYHPRTGTWAPTGSMRHARAGHTATLLPDGRVLVAGGANGEPLRSAELYDGRTGTWTRTADMAAAHAGHTATLLPGGQVLVAGGADTSAPHATAAAELYDVRRGRWSQTGSLLEPRTFQTATLLSDGRVLVAGGYDGNSFLSSAELYDPRTGAWMATGAMHVARALHTATLLPTGQVLVVGGRGDAGYHAMAELYNPTTGVWSLTGSMAEARALHTATLLPGGRVLVVGGEVGDGTVHRADAELYDVATGTWQGSGALNAGRDSQTATLLTTGELLVVGGCCDPLEHPLASSELFTPANPRLVLTPGSGGAGTTLIIEGSGFGPREAISIAWERRVVGTALTDDRGRFSWIMQAPRVAPERYSVVAVGQRSGIRARALFVVQ